VRSGGVYPPIIAAVAAVAAAAAAAAAGWGGPLPRASKWAAGAVAQGATPPPQDYEISLMLQVAVMLLSMACVGAVNGGRAGCGDRVLHVVGIPNPLTKSMLVLLLWGGVSPRMERVYPPRRQNPRLLRLLRMKG
jgi:hypothetical protein